MLKKFDMVSIGDCTHDTFIEIDEGNILCSTDTKKCQICLSWADKIPAKKVTQVPGVGNSANTAVGFARMGFKTGFYTHVGDDAIGRETMEVFRKEKIAQDFIKVDNSLPSNHHVAINQGAERTILVYHQPWKYNLPPKIKTKWFYFSSLAPAHQKLHKQVIDYAQKGVKVAFQPGTYQLREGKKKLAGVLKHTEVITLNKEEAQIVTGTTIRAPKKLMKELHSLGPRIVVMTDGPKGAYAYDGEHAYFVDPFPPKAKERTGAGDSFSSGFVGAMMRDKSVEEALLWGNANSTSVVLYVGAQEGLLSEAGIKKMIAKYKKVKPKKI